MEWRGSVREIHVYDDFAHHPTAIETTVGGLRARHAAGQHAPAGPAHPQREGDQHQPAERQRHAIGPGLLGRVDRAPVWLGPHDAVAPRDQTVETARSEERRVGKEGRSRWSPYH